MLTLADSRDDTTETAPGVTRLSHPVPTDAALSELAEAIGALPFAVGVVTGAATPLDHCRFCPSGPDDVPGETVTFVCHRASGSRFEYREECCAGCLHDAVRDTRRPRSADLADPGPQPVEVWLEIPTVVGE